MHEKYQLDIIFFEDYLSYYIQLTCILTIIDEWENFLERINQDNSGDVELQENSADALELRFWVSYRGQTLARTGQIL